MKEYMKVHSKTRIEKSCHLCNIPTVFISYNRRSSAFVDKIEAALAGKAEVHRDKDGIQPWGSITDFMKSIRKQDFAVLVISDAYLKSIACLYEVVQLMKDEGWNDKTMYVVLDDAKDIFNAFRQACYIQYWNDRCKDLKQKITDLPPEATSKLSEELKKSNNILLNIGYFVSMVADANNPPLEKVIAEIQKRVQSIRIASSAYEEKSAIVVGPSRLPPVVVPFINRETELKRIKNVLRQNGVVAIFGIGGIGKTALASQVTHQLANEKLFKDGIVWIDLRGISDVKQIVRLISQSFGFSLLEIEHPVDLTPYLSSRQALLILDNADDISQEDIHDILNARGRCAIMVTSRQRDLIKQGVSRQMLEPLPLEEAVHLLEARLSCIECANQVMMEICKLLGCLPLALELATGYLYRCDINPEEYLINLNKKPLAGIEEIEVAFDLSYKILSENSKQTLRAISFLGGDDFCLNVTAAMLEINIELVGCCFDELTARSLIKKTNQTNRFTIHTLLKEYARNKLPEEEINKFMSRLVAYYLLFCSKYGGANNFDGWKTLEIEAQNFLPVIDWCYEQEKFDDFIAFNEYTFHFFQVRGYSTVVFKYTQLTIDAAKRNPDNKDLIWQLTHRISRMIYQSRHDVALNIIKFVQPVFEKVQDIAGIAHIKRNLGELEEHKGNLQSAEVHYRQTLELAYQLPDVSDEDISFNNRNSRVAWTSWKLGRVLHMLGEYSEAEQLLDIAMGLQKQRNSLHGISAILCEFGHLERERQQYKKARNYYLQSLEILETIGYTLYEAEAKLGLGQIENISGDSEKAKKLIKDALNHFKNLGMTKHVKETRNLLQNLNGGTIK